MTMLAALGLGFSLASAWLVRWLARELRNASNIPSLF
jgi:hypothetical protein